MKVGFLMKSDWAELFARFCPQLRWEDIDGQQEDADHHLGHQGELGHVTVPQHRENHHEELEHNHGQDDEANGCWMNLKRMICNISINFVLMCPTNQEPDCLKENVFVPSLLIMSIKNYVKYKDNELIEEHCATCYLSWVSWQISWKIINSFVLLYLLLPPQMFCKYDNR